MKNEAFQKAKPYLANPDQLCYARLSSLEEGTARGQRIVDVFNGTGLAFTVTPDRGMNLVECSFRGIPMFYRAPLGHSAYNGEWLACWTAGMMTTSGVRNVGSPSGGQGLHGSISGCGAEHLSVSSRDGEISISGTLTEGALFSENLTLERTITTGYGRNVIELHDKLTNRGEKPAFTEILYHCNLGFPFLSPDIEFDLPEHEVQAAVENAKPGLAEWMKFPEPLPDFFEYCFRHLLPADAEGFACMHVKNRKLGIGLKIRYRTAELPYIVEWKKPSVNAYVMGLEPTNASLHGCEFDRQNGYGRMLAPGESMDFVCSWEFENLN